MAVCAPSPSQLQTLQRSAYDRHSIVLLHEREQCLRLFYPSCRISTAVRAYARSGYRIVLSILGQNLIMFVKTHPEAATRVFTAA